MPTDTEMLDWLQDHMVAMPYPSEDGGKTIALIDGLPNEFKSGRVDLRDVISAAADHERGVGHCFCAQHLEESRLMQETSDNG